VSSKIKTELMNASMKMAVNGGTTSPKTALIAAIATPLSLIKCAKRLVVHMIGTPKPASRAGKSSIQSSKLENKRTALTMAVNGRNSVMTNGQGTSATPVKPGKIAKLPATALTGSLKPARPSKKWTSGTAKMIVWIGLKTVSKAIATGSCRC